MWNLITRLLNVIGLLFATHIEVARQEAGRDARRMAGGVVMLVFAVLLLAPATLLAHAAFVWLVHDTWPLDWPAALLIVAGGDIVCSVPLMMWGRRRLRAPVLKDTRALVRRTAAALGD